MSQASSLLASLLVSALMLGAAACAPTVEIVESPDPAGHDGQNVGGVPSASGSGGSAPTPAPSGTSQPTPPPPAPIATNAIAIRYADVDWGAAGGGSGLDPNTLYLLIANGTTLECADPFTSNGCTTSWSVTIGLPPALQVPGTVALNDPSIISTFSETLGGNQGECSGGGGSFFDGSVEIASIDGSGVVFSLVGTDIGNVDANAQYTAPRCF